MFSSPREIHTLDLQFWLYHLWLPLVFVIPTLYLFEHSSIDVIFADFWYRFEGGYWALRKNWFTYDIMHRDGKRLIILIGLTMLTLYAASWKFDRLRPWRWSFAFALVGIILIPSTVAFIKQLSSVPCPWDISRYGGALAYVRNFQFASTTSAGHCFPAAHASSGFGLFAVYFAFGPFVKRHRLMLLLPGLVIGIAFGLAQELRGAHFISQDLWSVTISWFGALLLLKLAWQFKSPGNNQASKGEIP